MKRKLSFLALIMVCVLAISTIYTPAKKCDAADLKVGAWLGQAPSAGGIDAFQQLQGRKLDSVMFYIDWSTNFDSIRSSYIDPIVNNGSIPVVTWEAWGLSNSDVSSGTKDSYIRNMANGMKNYGKEIYVNLFHEANGDWYPWAVGDSKNNNDTFKAAYRHVVQIFKDAGARNVKFMFCINAGSSGAGTSFLGHYPGDDVVDIIAMDGYNWGNTQSWGSTWQSFDQIYSGVYQAACTKNKPIMISEMASTESGGNKAQWITDTYNTIRTKYPRIELVQWFNENKETNWTINSSSQVLAAYKTAIGGGSVQPTPTPTRTVAPTPTRNPWNPTPTPTQTVRPTVQPTVQPTVRPTGGNTGSANVQSSTTVDGQGIQARFTITPNGSAIDLSKVKIVYKFKKSSSATPVFWCDNAAAQLSVSPWYENLNSNVSTSVSKSGNEYTVTISFKNSYVLNPGTGSVQIQGRITNQDWSQFGTVTDASVSVL